MCLDSDCAVWCLSDLIHYQTSITLSTTFIKDFLTPSAWILVIPMMKVTHGIAAFTVGYLITSDIQFSLYAVLFGLISDLDLIVGIKHRTLTHSIVFLLSVSVLTGMINSLIGVAAFLGIGSHILLDMLTRSGVQLYWPMKRRVRIARFSYDGILVNYAIILTCWVLIIYFKGLTAFFRD